MDIKYIDAEGFKTLLLDVFIGSVSELLHLYFYMAK